MIDSLLKKVSAESRGQWLQSMTCVEQLNNSMLKIASEYNIQVLTIEMTGRKP